MFRIPFSVLALTLTIASVADARPPRRGDYVPYAYQPSYQPAYQPQPQAATYQANYPPPSSVVPATQAATLATTPGGTTADVPRLTDGATEALAEVNALRAAKGLYPYVRDDGLTQGAANVAAFRAQHLMAGHTSNDFGGLPAGATASGAGCAAWEPSWGWGSCCVDDVGPRYAGAAWVMGRDGRRYMHLFVR
jgi:hypothetical protein